MPYPLGSCTWVPADSYNYIDIYAAQNNNTRKESAGRVLENGKLLNQKKVVLDSNKLKTEKKRSNKYDELCLQYQYAQDWLNKRNSQVSVKLTRTELKVFIKWFDSRMSKFQKADGIDVHKVGEEFVKHKIFRSMSDALSFLAKVDLDGNGALSYEEFCEGLKVVNDYLQVLLLKKFIHSLQEKEYKSRKKHYSDAHNFSKGERLLKKDKPAAAAKVAPNKATVSGGDIALAATVTKVTLPGGGVMFTHTPARKKVEVSAANFPSVSPNKKNSSGREAPGIALTRARSRGSLPLVGGDDDVKSNSIRKKSVFISPGNDVLLHQHSLLQQATSQRQQPSLEEESVLVPPSPREEDIERKPCTKSSEQALQRISDATQNRLRAFLSERQVSFEEAEKLRVEDSDCTLDDISISLDEVSTGGRQRTSACTDMHTRQSSLRAWE